MKQLDLTSKLKNEKVIFLAIYIVFLIIVNVFDINLVTTLVLFFISYFVFLFYAFKKQKTLKNVILSAEVIFETIFFVYAVPATIIFILDGYEPRINFFLIDNFTMLETLQLYFKINCAFIILVVLTGGVHTLNFYNEEKNTKNTSRIKFDVFDIIAIVLVVYFYYLHFRNGLDIFGTYFHDLRELIQSNIHNFNSYIYLYMIPYSCVNIYRILFSNKKILENGKYKVIFTITLVVAFWGLSLLTDRRNFVTLLFMLILIYVYKLRKVSFKILLVAFICVVMILSISFFRSGTSNRSINNVLFLSLGEFVLTNYVSNYYINNCDDLQYGKTYIYNTLTSFLPSQIFPEKPELLSVQFQKEAKTNVAYAFNPVAEGLINFGKVGAIFAVPLVMFFWVKLAYIVSRKHILFFAIICAEAINFFRGIFSVSVFSVVVMATFTIFMLKLDDILYYIKKKYERIQNKKEPKVSVIMSTYNTKEEYLTKSIDSILNQTYKNFEFIIICDGSEKDLEIIKKYDDNRIKIIENKVNKGLPYSLNEALKIAEGKYIARMDSDDIALKDRLKEQVDFLETHNDIDICSMFCKKFGKDNGVDVLPYTKNNLLKIHLIFRNALVHPLIMMRREFIIINNLYYNEKVLCSQDFELWNRCKEIGKIQIIPKVGLLYRIHDNQISTEKKQKQLNYYKQILENNFISFKNFSVQENVDKVLILFDGDKKVDVLELANLSDMIDEIISKNTKYDKDDLETVLNLKLFNLTLKSKMLFLVLKNRKIRKKVFRFSNFKLNLKKMYYRKKLQNLKK